VYVDEIISLAISTSQAKLDHVARTSVTGIHDIFPANEDDALDPIALKKLLKEEGMSGYWRRSDKNPIWLEESRPFANISVAHHNDEQA